MIQHIETFSFLPSSENKINFISDFEIHLQEVVDSDLKEFEVVVTDDHNDSFVDVAVLNKQGDIVSLLAVGF